MSGDIASPLGKLQTWNFCKLLLKLVQCFFKACV